MQHKDIIQNDEKDLRSVKVAIANMSKYSLMRETPDLCDVMSIAHFVYFDKRGYTNIQDLRAAIDPSFGNNDWGDKHWLNKRTQELNIGYLTLGERARYPYDDIKFDFAGKNSEQILLIIYIGNPLFQPLRKCQSREILFKKKGLNVKRLQKIVEYQDKEEEDYDRAIGEKEYANITANRIRRLKTVF